MIKGSLLHQAFIKEQSTIPLERKKEKDYIKGWVSETEGTISLQALGIDGMEINVQAETVTDKSMDKIVEVVT